MTMGCAEMTIGCAGMTSKTWRRRGESNPCTRPNDVIAQARGPAKRNQPTCAKKLEAARGIEPLYKAKRCNRAGPGACKAQSTNVRKKTGGGEGNRTPVQGFAGPCLSHSATPPGLVKLA